jgi:DNA-binding MarR family transcriptional regulator
MTSAKPPSADPPIAEMAQFCLMNRTRVVARVMTGLFEEELRPLGIKGSQLNLLVYVARFGPLRRGEIGRVLHLDSSTLTRNLRVMIDAEWIEEVPEGGDGRGLAIQAAPLGQALLRQAYPRWQRAQARAAKLLGSDTDALMRVSTQLLRGAAP